MNIYPALQNIRVLRTNLNWSRKFIKASNFVLKTINKSPLKKKNIFQ